jgi:Trk K+ transport system NAD-binding subunit
MAMESGIKYRLDPSLLKDGEYVVSAGGTVVRAGDRLHLLADRGMIREIRSLLEQQTQPAS